MATCGKDWGGCRGSSSVDRFGLVRKPFQKKELNSTPLGPLLCKYAATKVVRGNFLLLLLLLRCIIRLT